jgi:hypothetical protein
MAFLADEMRDGEAGDFRRRSLPDHLGDDKGQPCLAVWRLASVPRASRHYDNKICVAPRLRAQTIVGYNE